MGVDGPSVVPRDGSDDWGGSPPVEGDDSSTLIADVARGRAPRAASRVEWLALAIGVLPIVVAAVAAVARGWMPVGDAGYFTARSMDVFTRHHPLLGAWTSGSAAVGEPFNNLGPLQLDLLAPFTKISPYAGTAVGTAAINVGCVVGVWSTARRLLGPSGVAVAMAATLVVEAAMGGLAFVDPRQQVALLLPFWLLLWLASSLWMGLSRALPAIVFVASLIVQTHLSYSYLVAAVTVASFVAWLAHHRMRPRARRSILLAAGIAVLAWIQPLWDQIFETGNLTTALGRAGAGVRPGYSDAVRVVADGPFLPPFWSPGSIDAFSPQRISESLGGPTIAIVGWVLALGIVLGSAWRRLDRVTVAMAGVSLVGLTAGIHTAATIPYSKFGLSPVNYLWLWPLSVFVSTVIGLGGWRALHARALGGSKVPHLAIGVGAAAVACVPALRQVGVTTTDTWVVNGASPQLAAVTEQFDENLSDMHLDGPVLIGGWEANGPTIWIHTVRAAITEAGAEFSFLPSDVNLARYGRDRCERGSARHMLRSSEDPGIQLGDDEILIARGEPLSDDLADHLWELRVEMGDGLRRGDTLRVDLEAVRDISPTAYEWLRDITDDHQADVSGRWLALAVDSLADLGAIEASDDTASDLDTWAELERRHAWSTTIFYLAPVDEPIDGSCDDPIDVPE